LEMRLPLSSYTKSGHRGAMDFVPACGLWMSSWGSEAHIPALEG
jgi:hypothetical protein